MSGMLMTGGIRKLMSQHGLDLQTQVVTESPASVRNIAKQPFKVLDAP